MSDRVNAVPTWGDVDKLFEERASRHHQDIASLEQLRERTQRETDELQRDLADAHRELQEAREQTESLKDVFKQRTEAFELSQQNSLKAISARDEALQAKEAAFAQRVADVQARTDAVHQRELQLAEAAKEARQVLTSFADHLAQTVREVADALPK